MSTVIYALLVLGGLIFFHELGHFLVARAFGMGVSTFSLGFGPKLLKRQWGKTEYCLSAVPLGGYVALVGEEDDAELPAGFSEAESFSRRPPWQRLLVVAAGPVFNLLLAWFLCWGLAYGQGQMHLLPQIGALEEKGPAAVAGVQPGDTVVAINGEPITQWVSMAKRINASGGQPISLEVAGKSGNRTYSVTPRETVRKSIFGEDEKAWVIGIRASGQTVSTELGFWESSLAGARRSWEMVELTWLGFVKLAQRVVPLDQVGGPIMIAQMVGQQAEQGLGGVLALTALISINLAILNLLPIPVLDGGHIVFCALETIFRRPISPRVRDVTTRMGFAFLICLMVLATFNDVWRIVKNVGMGG